MQTIPETDIEELGNQVALFPTESRLLSQLDSDYAEILQISKGRSTSQAETLDNKEQDSALMTMVKVPEDHFSFMDWKLASFG